MRLLVRLCTLLSLSGTACIDSRLTGIDDDDDDRGFDWEDDDDEYEEGHSDYQDPFPEGRFEGSLGIEINLFPQSSPSIPDDCVGSIVLEVRNDQDPEIQGMGECSFQSGLLDYVSGSNEGDITGSNSGSNGSGAQGRVWATIVGDTREEASGDWSGGADGDEVYAEFDGDVAFQVAGERIEVDYVGYFWGVLVSD